MSIIPGKVLWDLTQYISFYTNLMNDIGLWCYFTSDIYIYMYRELLWITWHGPVKDVVSEFENPPLEASLLIKASSNAID